MQEEAQNELTTEIPPTVEQPSQGKVDQPEKKAEGKKYLIGAGIAAAVILIGIGVASVVMRPRMSKPRPGTGSPTTTSVSPTSAAVSPVPSGSPTTSGKGIPFGPFHFGERVADYDVVKDGVSAGDVFTGGFASLGKQTPAGADAILAAAAKNNYGMIVNLGVADPCNYWDGATFDSGGLLGDVAKMVPTLEKYYPATVRGILLLNEPHNPRPVDQGGCVAIPPATLYSVAKMLREGDGKTAGLNSTKLAGIPLGYGVHATYFDGKISGDGTITLANPQYAPGRGGTASQFMASQEAVARKLGMKLYATVNANKSGDSLDDYLLEVCRTVDPAIVIEVGYWTWTVDGGNQSVPLTSLTAVRDACSGR